MTEAALNGEAGTVPLHAANAAQELTDLCANGGAERRLVTFMQRPPRIAGGLRI